MGWVSLWIGRRVSQMAHSSLVATLPVTERIFVNGVIRKMRSDERWTSTISFFTKLYETYALWSIFLKQNFKQHPSHPVRQWSSGQSAPCAGVCCLWVEWGVGLTLGLMEMSSTSGLRECWIGPQPGLQDVQESVAGGRQYRTAGGRGKRLISGVRAGEIRGNEACLFYSTCLSFFTCLTHSTCLSYQNTRAIRANLFLLDLYPYYPSL